MSGQFWAPKAKTIKTFYFGNSGKVPWILRSKGDILAPARREIKRKKDFEENVKSCENPGSNLFFFTSLSKNFSDRHKRLCPNPAYLNL